MVKGWLLLVALGLAGCDTFRSLDAVPMPGDLDADLADTADVDVRADLGDPPDAASDAAHLDAADASAPVDAGEPDQGVAPTCPPGPRPVPWDADGLPAFATIVVDSRANVYPAISLASGPADGPTQFVGAYRVNDGGEVVSRLFSVEPPGTTVATLTVGHAAAEPFTDIAVGRAAGGDGFVFFASAATPGCAETGIQAVGGVVAGQGAGFAQRSIFTISADCGLFAPRVAVGGADGAPANLLFVHTSASATEVLAYGLDDPQAGPVATASGDPRTRSLAVSQKDAVIVGTPDLGQWNLWRPGDAPALALPLVADRTPALDHLGNDCYATASPRGENLELLAVDCTSDCAFRGDATVVLAGRPVLSTAMAAIPGGGFVAVTHGDGVSQAIDAHFFDAAMQPVAPTRIPIAQTDGEFGAIAVAAASSSDGVFAAIGYTIDAADRQGLEVVIVRLPVGEP